MAADAAALRERIVKVKHSRLALVTLWHEAVAAAEDATVGSVGQLIKIAMLRVKNALPFLEC
jgi:hypothetical protein